MDKALRTNDDATGQRRQQIKLIASSVVILLCLGWMIFLFVSNRTVTVIKPESPAQHFIVLTPPIFEGEKFELVHLTPSEDGKSVRVTGSVKTQAEMAELKSGLEGLKPKMPAGESVELTWEVRVGR